MKSFEVRIPARHLSDVKAKLAREQRHKAPQDQVRYSYTASTFWRWEHPEHGWCQRQCSRNGKVLGKVVGRTWSEVTFTKRPDGSSGFSARSRSTSGNVASEAVTLPDFLPKEYVCKPRMISPKIRITYPSLEKPMSPLKLSILLWYAARPYPYTLPTGAVDSDNVRTAHADLISAGLLTLHVTGYHLTDKGKVFVEHLTTQPLPVQTTPTWVMPASGGLVGGHVTDAMKKPGWL